MTLLKFTVTLLSTMVVAVNLSSEPANSLAFAQLHAVTEMSAEQEQDQSEGAAYPEM